MSNAVMIHPLVDKVRHLTRPRFLRIQQLSDFKTPLGIGLLKNVFFIKAIYEYSVELLPYLNK